ncbi:MAG: ParB N-terminal domain-containing protein [Planctomycetes bacterium]|nr:ParB N-terminal domain-containing protein [Planctomycetota bacterium]
MLTTKRYDYVPFGLVHKHPLIANHRAVNPQKVHHYKRDILSNGLLEPLVVWERNRGEYFLVGGFHRHAAIDRIRHEYPGYYDRIDVRVVAGDLEEMRALNLKLNADRLDARVVEYFDTVIFLNNANWDRDRIATFLDKSQSWIDDIIRFAPSMDPRLRTLLEAGKLSWGKAKAICRRILDAEPGRERAVADAALRELEAGAPAAPRRVLSVKSARSRLARHVAKHPSATYTVSGQDLLSLLTLLSGKAGDDTEVHTRRVQKTFPGLIAAEPSAESTGPTATGEAAAE